MDVDPWCSIGQVQTTENLYMREGRNTEQDVIRLLPAGTLLDAWAEADGWLLVQAADGVTGWCHGAYLRVVKP